MVEGGLGVAEDVVETRVLHEERPAVAELVVLDAGVEADDAAGVSRP